jgi:hypothetical protein
MRSVGAMDSIKPLIREHWPGDGNDGEAKDLLEKVEIFAKDAVDGVIIGSRFTKMFERGVIEHPAGMVLVTY